MKTKIKNQQEDKQEHQGLEKSEIQSQQQQPQPQAQQQEAPPPPPPQQQPNNNKRKAMEEGLSPDRTRPRYNGITTVV